MALGFLKTFSPALLQIILPTSRQAKPATNTSVDLCYSVTDLGSLADSCSDAFSINDAGEVLGYSSTKDGAKYTFLGNKGMMADLSSICSHYSVANDINKEGQVVGYCRACTSSNGSYHAFLWTNGNAIDLGTLGGSYSKAYGINNAGEIVGESLTSSGSLHAFLWDNGTMFDLNSLLSPNSGWILDQALGINNKGQIVGKGTFNGQDRAFLLAPNTKKPG